SDANAARARGDEARQRDRIGVHRARWIEMDLAEPHAVEPAGFGGVGEVDRFLERRDLAQAGPSLLEEDAEVHGPQPQSRRLASFAPSPSAPSLAHTTLSAHISEPAKVPKPQSVEAMTRVRSPIAPTIWAMRSAMTSGCST